MGFARTAVVAAVLGLVGLCASAQGPAIQSPATVLTRSELDAKVQSMRAKAKAEGLATVKLDTYPNHYTMLAVRTRTGGAEIHTRFADFFLVLEGHGRLVTGGSLAGETATDTDEPRGTAVTGGTEQEVKAGDVIHIPAGVAHQLVLPQGQEFAYYVVKVQEK